MSLKTLAFSRDHDLALAWPLILVPVWVAGRPDTGAGSVINAQLNGLFTLTLAVGYFWAAQAVEQRRGYLWVAGVLAKGGGVRPRPLARHSRSFLLLP